MSTRIGSSDGLGLTANVIVVYIAIVEVATFKMSNVPIKAVIIQTFDGVVSDDTGDVRRKSCRNWRGSVGFLVNG